MPLSASNREKLKRGVGSKTEGPQTELLENRKVSLSAPQPNFLYFLTSFSNFGLASWKNVPDGGGEPMWLGIPRLLPPLTLAGVALHLWRPQTPQPKQSPRLLTPQPDPNSSITHCLLGIAILIPSPLDVDDADVTPTPTCMRTLPVPILL